LVIIIIIFIIIFIIINRNPERRVVGERRTLSPSKSKERCVGVLPASGVGVDGQ
jgi:hypothetical protein